MFGVEITPDESAIDQLVDAGIYMVGDVDEIAEQLKEYFHNTGGFGTLLIVAGKHWATAEKRAHSMRMFIELVAPKIRELDFQYAPASGAAK